mgnify:CR=1 FL=1
MNLVFRGDKFWHFQMVCRFHRNSDIGNLAIDAFLCIGLRLIGIDNLTIPLVRYKVVVSVFGNEASEAFS